MRSPRGGERVGTGDPPGLIAAKIIALGQLGQHLAAIEGPGSLVEQRWLSTAEAARLTSEANLRETLARLDRLEPAR